MTEDTGIKKLSPTDTHHSPKIALQTPSNTRRNRTNHLWNPTKNSNRLPTTFATAQQLQPEENQKLHGKRNREETICSGYKPLVFKQQGARSKQSKSQTIPQQHNLKSRWGQHNYTYAATTNGGSGFHREDYNLVSLQHPNEIILTLPGALNAVINSGPNIAEAINVGTVSWIPEGIFSTSVCNPEETVFIDMEPFVAKYKPDWLNQFRVGKIRNEKTNIKQTEQPRQHDENHGKQNTPGNPEHADQTASRTSEEHKTRESTLILKVF